jgi:hypothetical protein
VKAKKKDVRQPSEDREAQILKKKILQFSFVAGRNTTAREEGRGEAGERNWEGKAQRSAARNVWEAEEREEQKNGKRRSQHTHTKKKSGTGGRCKSSVTVGNVTSWQWNPLQLALREIQPPRGTRTLSLNGAAPSFFFLPLVQKVKEDGGRSVRDLFEILLHLPSQRVSSHVTGLFVCLFFLLFCFAE